MLGVYVFLLGFVVIVLIVSYLVYHWWMKRIEKRVLRK